MLLTFLSISFDHLFLFVCSFFFKCIIFVHLVYKLLLLNVLLIFNHGNLKPIPSGVSNALTCNWSKIDPFQQMGIFFFLIQISPDDHSDIIDHCLTPNSRCTFCDGMSLNIHSFIHSFSKIII